MTLTNVRILLLLMIFTVQSISAAIPCFAMVLDDDKKNRPDGEGSEAHIAHPHDSESAPGTASIIVTVPVSNTDAVVNQAVVKQTDMSHCDTLSQREVDEDQTASHFTPFDGDDAPGCCEDDDGCSLLGCVSLVATIDQFHLKLSPFETSKHLDVSSFLPSARFSTLFRPPIFC